MDMPKHCGECQLCVGFYGKQIAVCTGSTGTKKNDYPKEGRPSYCPLRELPKKLEVKDDKSMSEMLVKDGYNICIDEILGGAENV